MTATSVFNAAMAESARLLLKYGDHTRQCATREYHETQHGGFHSYKGLPCNCGWLEIKAQCELQSMSELDRLRLQTLQTEISMARALCQIHGAA